MNQANALLRKNLTFQGNGTPDSDGTQIWSIIQPKCPSTFAFSVPFNFGNDITEIDITCMEGLRLWHNDSSMVNDELFKGYPQGNPERRVNEILVAYDFLHSNDKKFNVNIWYNSTYTKLKNRLHVSRLANMVSNSYLQFVRGAAGFKILLDFVVEMPKIYCNQIRY